MVEPWGVQTWTYLLLVSPLSEQNKLLPDGPIKVCIFSCKVKLIILFFVIMFPLAVSTIKPHCYHRPVLLLCCLCCRPFEVQNSAEEWPLCFYSFIYLFSTNKSNTGAECALFYQSLYWFFFFFFPPARAGESNQNATLKPFDFATKVDGLPACKLPIR